MTPVQGTNTGAVNWQSLLDKLVETSGAQGTAKISDDNRSLVFTTTVNGVESKVTVRIPDDLDLPGEVDEAAIASLVGKLSDPVFNLTEDEIKAFQDEITKIYKGMSAAVAKTKSASTGSVMFDLYKLMALLVEVAQSQRDAARDLRTAQSAQIQNSIQSQAETQRNAALVGLIVGVVCGAISALISGAMLFKQGVAYKDQLSAARSSGADAAQTNANMLTGADTAAHANAQLQKVEGQVGAGTAATVKGEMDAKIAGTKATYDQKTQLVAEKQQALDTAQGELDAARAALAPKEAAVNEAQQAVNAARAEAQIQDPQRSATGAKADYIRDCMSRHEVPSEERLAKFDNAIRAEAPDAPLAAAKADLANAQQAVAGKELAVTNATTALTNAKAEQQAARADYRASILTAADEYAGKYASAVTTDGPNSAAANSARDNMRMAQAYAGSKLAEEGITTATEHRADVAAANAAADTAAQRLNTNADYRDALHNIEYFTGLNAINTAVSNMLQGMTQNVVAMINAKATERSGEQEQQKEQLEQSKDLFQQAQSLIDAVVQLMQAVASAESQSMRDAIQA